MTQAGLRIWPVLWLALLLALLYWLAPVLTPFMVSAILAYMGDPLVDRLEKYRLPRTLAVVVVFVILILLAVTVLIVLIPMIERQFSVLASKLPTYLDWLIQQGLPGVTARLGIDMPSLDVAQIKQMLQQHWQTAGGFAANLVSSISRSGMALLAVVANVVLIPVVTFYLLRDWDVLVARIHSYLPRRYERVISQVASESDEVLGAFLRGQLLVMLALALIYAVGLSLVGLDLAVLIGLLAGLVSFVPYLGFIVGILVAGLAALMQFQEFIPLVYVAAVFGVGQLLEGMLLTPMLVGDRIGLHPVAVIFAVLAGGQLFGFFGVLLALPVAAVIAVVLRHLNDWYQDSDWYSTEPPSDQQ